MTEALQTLSCDINPRGITVGEKALLNCPFPETQSGASLSVQFINAQPKVTFEVEFLGPPTSAQGRINQAVTSYRVGDHELASIVLKVGERFYKVSPQNLKVNSVISGQTPEQAPGQTTEQPTPYPLFDPARVSIPWWWWAIWISIIFAIGLFAFFKWQRWQKERQKQRDLIAQAKPLSPKDRFRNRLRRLESQAFHHKGEYKTFALELTNILKVAISDQFKFPASDQTTEEVLTTLERKHRSFFQKSGNDLEKLLSDLDQIKFAKTETTSDNCSSMLDRGLEIGRQLFEDQL